MAAVRESAPLRAAIYIRVSDPKQESGTSLETQEESCRRYCAEHGYTVVGVYRDVLTAKYLWERESLTRLRHEMPRDIFDVVVVHVLDRLSRQQHHQGLILSECEHAGVRLESATEDIDNSPIGKFLRSAINFNAEMEREKIRERVGRSIIKRAEKGVPISGARVLYGYQWASTEKQAYVEKEPDASVVRRIFAEVAAGTPLSRLAAQLTADGIPTPMGRPRWAKSTVYSILTHPAYIGNGRALRYRMEEQEERDPYTGYITVKRHANLRRDADDDETYPLAIKPLITPETAQAVTERLAANRVASPRNNRRMEATLLRAGFVTCGYCGSNMVVGWFRDRPFYRCGRHQLHKEDCRGHMISAPLLDDAVWQHVESLLTDPERITHELEKQRAENHLADDLAAIERRLAEIVKQQGTLARRVAVIDDDDAAAPLLGELKQLSAQKQALMTDRTRLQASITGWEAAQTRMRDLVDWCRKVATRLDTVDYDTKRLALYTLNVQVCIYHKGADHDRYVIRASIPLDEATPAGIASITAHVHG
jgi:site-specific DNA recombinase